MSDFASVDLTADQMNAIVEKLGGHEAALRFLLDKPANRWREEGGVIYFTITSDGTDGEAWIDRLEKIGCCVGDHAKNVLCSKDFKPTNGVTYEVAVLKGLLFNNDSRITKNIREKASEMKLTTPTAEVSCLIRDNFTNEEFKAMDLKYIVAMHEPINDFDGGPYFLRASSFGSGRWLDVYDDHSNYRWFCEYGFAFVCSQACQPKL